MYGVGDQLHAVIKSRIHKQLDELVGWGKDLTQLPDVQLLRRGGCFVTSKGYKRGAPLFLYCLAVAIVRAKLSKYLVAAAFCKCGFYDKKAVANLFDFEQSLVDKGIAELESTQADIKSLHQWLHKSSDFSGQPKERQYSHFGNLANLPLQSKPEYKDAAIQALKNHETHCKRVQNMGATALSDLPDIKEMPDLNSPELDSCIVQRDRSEVGTLANHGQEPDKYNAGERECFQRCTQVLFKDIDVYKNKPEHFMQLVMDFQLHLLQRRYSELAKGDSVWARRQTFHQYVWHILKKIHHMDLANKRRSVLLHIIGDFKKYSPCPSGKKDPTGTQAV